MKLNIKKIILAIFIIIMIFFSFKGSNIALENCNYSAEGGLIDTLTACIDEENFKGVTPEESLDLSSGGGFSIMISKWVKNISIILFIVAVGSLIYASFLLVLSGGEEEKIKKAKDIIKWSILGFLGLISVGIIILLITKTGYWLSV